MIITCQSQLSLPLVTLSTFTCVRCRLTGDFEQIHKITQNWTSGRADKSPQHAPQYPNNGLGASLQLLDWLENFTFPQEQKFKDVAYAKGVYERVVQGGLAVGVSLSSFLLGCSSLLLWVSGLSCLV